MSEYKRRLKELATLLRVVRLGAIVIAVYDTPLTRERTTTRLQGLLDKVSWQEITLTPQHPSLQAALKSLSNLTHPTIILVHGLDDLPEDDQLRVILHLNLGREFFVRFAFPIVLWVKSQTAQELARQAPDFWHWRSGTFEFTAERESVERRIRIYELLLEQYQTLGIDNPAAIEEITSQLSRLKSAAM